MRRNFLVVTVMWALFIALSEPKQDGICPPNRGEYNETPNLYNSIRRYCAHYSSPEDWHKRKADKQVNGVRKRTTALERFNNRRAR